VRAAVKKHRREGRTGVMGHLPITVRLKPDTIPEGYV
jgi:hypothetical protein